MISFVISFVIWSWQYFVIIQVPSNCKFMSLTDHLAVEITLDLFTERWFYVVFRIMEMFGSNFCSLRSWIQLSERPTLMLKRRKLREIHFTQTNNIRRRYSVTQRQSVRDFFIPYKWCADCILFQPHSCCHACKIHMKGDELYRFSGQVL